MLLLAAEAVLDVGAAVAEAAPWLQSVHAQSPGAAVFLVCSRAESPPPGVAPAAWRADVAAFARAVRAEVRRHASDFSRM
jgi:hypothetical protein